MLEVVEHEQERPVTEDANELLSRGLITDIAKGEAVGDGGEDEGRISHGGQVNPDHAISEVPRDLLSKRLRQTGLADTTGTG